MFAFIVGEIKVCSPKDFWELSLKEINAIAHGHKKAVQKMDYRMRRTWAVIYKAFGSNVKEETLWPLDIDFERLEEVKERNIRDYDLIKKFADLKGKPKNGGNN